jgi:hypothetical protein
MDDLLRYHGADWCGFALTLASLHLLGNHRRSGFLLGAASSIAWAAFSVQAESSATLLANVVFCGMNLRGWAKWRRIPGTNGVETPDAV